MIALVTAAILTALVAVASIILFNLTWRNVSDSHPRPKYDDEEKGNFLLIYCDQLASFIHSRLVATQQISCLM